MRTNRFIEGGRNFLDKYWGWGFITTLSWFIYMIGSHFIENTTNWVFIHAQIYMVLVLLIGFHTFGGKITPFSVIVLSLLQNLLSLDDYVAKLANFFFQRPEMSFLTQHLVVQDTNVFLSLVIVLLLVINVLVVMIAYILGSRKLFSYFFNIITLSALIAITLLFHYVLIEKEFRQTITQSLQLQANIFKFPPSERATACQSMNVYCLQGEGQIKQYLPKLAEKADVLHASVVKGNYTISDESTHIYLVNKQDNFYIVDTQSATQAFNFSEKWLMFCLTIAHGIWLFFYVWLQLFHRRIHKRRMGRIVNWKTISESSLTRSSNAPVVTFKKQ